MGHSAARIHEHDKIAIARAIAGGVSAATGGLGGLAGAVGKLAVDKISASNPQSGAIAKEILGGVTSAGGPGLGSLVGRFL